MNFVRLRTKLEAIIGIIRAPNIFSVIKIAPEMQVRASIDEILRKYLSARTAEAEIVRKNIADEILAKIQDPPKSPTSAQVESLVDQVLGQAFWYHSQLAGLTTYWEFRVRLFAERVGVPSSVPIPEKSKKNRANKSIEHRRLSDVINDLNKKTDHRLNLKLLELAEVRNSIVHCNPQGMKAHSKILLGKQVHEKMRGNVVVFATQKGTVENLSDVTDEAASQAHDVFGHFLETFNSPLPKKLFSLFEKSVIALDQLIAFNAYSFDERRPIFEKLVFQGVALSDDDRKLFRSYFASPYNPKGDADQLLDAVQTSFRLKT